jgi:uncharacterized protein with FMN-binding domain
MMKRVLASITATVASLVLLLGFKTHAPADATMQTASTPANDTNTSTTTTTSTSAPSSTTARNQTTTTAATRTKTTTVNGNEANTKWGPVQVQVTVTDGKITNVVALEYPDTNNRDVSINNRAIPALVSQTLKAQSADISGVSGATYTTEGFITSLQSALSKAGSK